jgi:hypothetical protein
MTNKVDVEIKDQATEKEVDFLGMRVLTTLEEEGVAFAGDHDHDHTIA